MATTNAVNNTTGTSTTSNSSAVSSKNDVGSSDRFLKLLVAQMQNQDPLNPMDNAQVTSQMAQIQTVQGISDLKTSIEAMSASYADGQSLQAASLVGHNVLVAGKSITVSGEKAQAGYELTDSADQVSVSVRDTAGKLVGSFDLGPQKAGVHTFDWDAKGVADQTYNFTVTSVQNGKGTAVDTLSLQRINGVSRSDSGTTLYLDKNTSMALSDVKQIL